MRSEDIEIPEPCHADWDKMRPEERGRFCFDCRKKVHDLSAMTETEAERFVDASANDDICVSYRHDEDGGIVFRPAAPIVPISRLRRRSAAVAVATAGLAATLAACTPHGEGPKIHETETVTVSFQVSNIVIPHQSEQPVPPPVEPPVLEEEPCDPEITTPPAVEIDRPRVQGRMPIRRTAGKPVMRKMGAKAPPRTPSL